MLTDYPKPMMHPHYAQATISRDGRDYNGTSVRYPPESAVSADHEAELRSRGYLEVGEALPMTAYQEFPLMLRHPEHADEIPAQIGAERVDGAMRTFAIAGIPEKYPDVVVNNGVEETAWYAKGYLRPGAADAKSYDRAVEAPGMPGAEWPKWVDGVLMQDPTTPAPPTNMFPMWCTPPNGKPIVVNSRQEYEGLCGPWPYGEEAKTAEEMKPVAAPALDPALMTEFEQFMAWRAAQAAPPEPAEVTEPSDKRDELLAQATELGIDADRRWGAKRLQDAIDAALAA